MTVPRIVYRFTQDEYADLLCTARERQGSKDARGIRDGRMVASGVDAHLLGIAGEVAVCHLTGGSMDHTSRLGGDDGAPDVVLTDGRTVNVKTRSEPGYAFLLTPGHADLGADVAVLAWRLPQQTAEYPLTIEIAGWADRETFAEHRARFDYGHGPRVGLAPRFLCRLWRP